MAESTHDLIAAKAARLRALLQLVKPNAATADGAEASAEADLDDRGEGPTWSGWNN